LIGLLTLRGRFLVFRHGVFMLSGLLAGCASVPLSVTIATQVAEGVSYVATGKGGTDHILSAVLEQDCALYRAIKGAPVCIHNEQEVPETAILAGEESPPAADPMTLPPEHSRAGPSLGDTTRREAPSAPSIMADLPPSTGIASPRYRVFLEHRAGDGGDAAPAEGGSPWSTEEDGDATVSTEEHPGPASGGVPLSDNVARRGGEPAAAAGIRLGGT
jgi:hypothetical protein